MRLAPAAAQETSQHASYIVDHAAVVILIEQGTEESRSAAAGAFFCGRSRRVGLAEAAHDHGRDDRQHLFQDVRADAGLISGLARHGAADVFAAENMAQNCIAVAGGRVLAEKLDLAQSRMARREVLAAREILAQAEIASAPDALFALAETFDPNVLASLNVSHVGADVEKARNFYGQALAGGVIAARQRLLGLQ